MNLHTFKRFFIVSAVALSLGACSDDDDNGTELVTDNSSISFTVSGAVEAEKTGLATMGQTQVGNTYQLTIRGNDGDEETDQSYTLDFNLGPQPNPFDAPEPGTYDIRTLVDAAGGRAFHVSYVDQPFGNSVNYGGADVSGELVITELNDDFIEGTFSFTAKSLVTEESIQVTNGEFKAINNL